MLIIVLLLTAVCVTHRCFWATCDLPSTARKAEADSLTGRKVSCQPEGANLEWSLRSRGSTGCMQLLGCPAGLQWATERCLPHKHCKGSLLPLPPPPPPSSPLPPPPPSHLPPYHHHHHCNKMFAKKLKRLMILKLCLIFSRQVEACRSKLFVIMGKDPDSDDVPPPNPEWKKVCSRCILPEVKKKNVSCLWHFYFGANFIIESITKSACTFTYTFIGLLYVTIYMCVCVCV